MKSEMAEAFDELLEAQEEVLGKKQERIFINGTHYRGIVEDINSDMVELAGGRGEAGGFRCQIAVSDFGDQGPEKGDSISAHGMDLQILSTIKRNGVTYEITAGDLSAEDSG